MPRKPKTPQKEDLVEVNGRDSFQTPNYAVDLLVPFLRSLEMMHTMTFTSKRMTIWEPAAGLGKIVNRLKFWEFDVFGTDLSHKFPVNFLTDTLIVNFDCIVTNPPFSLKKKFYEQCVGYGVPFALLLPADYSSWVIDAINKDSCEKIIPTRRIDYITPNVLQKIHEGEIWDTYVKNTTGIETLSEFKEQETDDWKVYLQQYKDFCNWTSIYDAPSMFLRKYSSSQFHSMWLTKGFSLGKSETFVELTNDQKKFGI